MRWSKTPGIDSGPAQSIELAERVLIWLGPMVLLGVVTNVARFVAYGGALVTVVQCTAMAAMYVCYLFRRHLAGELRALCYCSCILLIGLSGLAYWGLLGQGFSILVLVYVVAAMGGLRVWALMIAVSIILVSLIAGGFIYGYLPIRVNPETFLRSPVAWISGMANLLLISLSAILWNVMSKQLGRNTEALRLEQKRLQGILENVPCVVYRCTFDPEWTVSFISDEIEALAGYPPDAFVGGRARSFLSIVHSEDQTRVAQNIRSAVETRQSWDLSYRIQRSDGGLRWVLERGTAVYGEDGSPAYLDGFVLDDTERKQAEERAVAEAARINRQQQAIGAIAMSPKVALGDIPQTAREVTELAARTIGVARASVWLFDTTGEQLRCVDLFEAAGATHSAGAVLERKDYREEFNALGRAKYVDAHDPLTDPRTTGYVDTYLKPLGITSMIDGAIRAGGRDFGTLCLEHVATAHHWEPDEIAFVCQLADQVALVILNHERNCAEQELKKSELRYSTIFNTVHDALFIHDVEGRVLDINQAMLALYGVTREEALGMRIATDFSAPDNSFDQLPLVWSQVVGGTSVGLEWNARRPHDGTCFPAEVWLERITLADEALILANVRDVSDRRRAEQALKRSRDQFQSLVSSIPGTTYRCLLDAHWTMLYISADIERLTGYPPEDFINNAVRSFESVIHRDDTNAVARQVGEAVAAGRTWEMEYRLCHADHSVRWVYEKGRAISDRDGRAIYLDGFILDITQRKQIEEERTRAEEALRRSEEHFRYLFERNPAPMLVYERGSMQLLDINDAFELHYGYTRSEALAMHLTDLYPEVEKDAIAKLAAGLRGHAYVGEWHHLKRDGSTISIIARSHDLRFAGRDARVAVITDITAIREAEEKLRYHSAFEHLVADVSSRFVASGAHNLNETIDGALRDLAQFVAAETAYIFSFSEDGSHFSMTHEWHAPHFPVRKEALQNIAAETLPWWMLRLKKGETLAAESIFDFPPEAQRERAVIEKQGITAIIDVPLYVEGRLEGTFGFGSTARRRPWTESEITLLRFLSQVLSSALRRVRAEEALMKARDELEMKVQERTIELRMSENRFRTLFSGSRDAIMVLDTERYLDCNAATLALFGCRNAEEFVGHSPSALSPLIQPCGRESQSLFEEHLDRAVQEGQGFFEWVHRRVDGSTFSAEILLSPMVLEEKSVFQAIVRDVTQRKQAEQALERANARLTAANRELEAFSYSVSHDLRTPLRAIDGFSQAILEEYGEVLGETGHGYLNRVRAASNRMGRLIDDMLVLARVTRTEPKVTTVDLSALATQVIEDLRAAEPERRVDCSIQDGLAVRGDAHMLHSVLGNLLGNAWKFTRHTPMPRIEFGVDESSGEKVYFIRDNGAGFDMAYARKLFGVFQRLHSATDYPGTGVGLATVQRIVTRHNGRVWAEGKVGEGAVFFFVLGQL